MAATGAAVGLGNIWKFPYTAGENGGGAFVLVYLVCVAMFGLPVMMTEIMLGKQGRLSPINTMRSLAKNLRRSPAWSLLGWSGLLAGLLILSYYSVIAGWALAYVPMMAAGDFVGISAQQAEGTFSTLISDPTRLIIWHTVFMIMTMWVIARGLEKGLEKAIVVLLPALFVLLLILVGYAAFSTNEFMHGVSFLFKPDFQQLLYPNCQPDTVCQFSIDGVLSAMGLAFFSLSLGMGAIMIYGAYLPENSSISQAAIYIVIADTAVALIAGLAIFPIVFSNGLDPAGGPGLVFTTLPIAFGNMNGGVLFGSLFFILLVFAAWTSAFSLLEPVVAWLVESGRFTRRAAVYWSGGIIWAVGLLTVFSFNILADFHPLSSLPILSETSLGSKNFFNLFDYVTSNIMLPLGGLLMAIFAAWLMPRDVVSKALGFEHSDLGYRLWLFFIRYITPLGVGLVFLKAVGLL